MTQVLKRLKRLLFNNCVLTSKLKANAVVGVKVDIAFLSVHF